MVGSDNIADTPASSLAAAIPHHGSGSPLLARGPVVVEAASVTYDVTYERLCVLPLQR